MLTVVRPERTPSTIKDRSMSYASCTLKSSQRVRTRKRRKSTAARQRRRLDNDIPRLCACIHFSAEPRSLTVADFATSLSATGISCLLAPCTRVTCRRNTHTAAMTKHAYTTHKANFDHPSNISRQIGKVLLHVENRRSVSMHGADGGSDHQRQTTSDQLGASPALICDLLLM